MSLIENGYQLASRIILNLQMIKDSFPYTNMGSELKDLNSESENFQNQSALTVRRALTSFYNINISDVLTTLTEDGFTVGVKYYYLGKENYVETDIKTV